MITDDMLDAHMVILGATGGGKSYTARGLVERLLDLGRRVCILDPVGVWWGLKANVAGDGPGRRIAVLGGDHADMPLTEKMGKPLARAVAENNLPLVIDTADMGVGERNRFLNDFLRELYRCNKKALWLVMEETDEAAPQKPVSEGAPMLLDAVDRIARRGRSRGFRLVAISQRPQVIHKNILTQVRTMVAHRLSHNLDVKAVEDWMRANSDPETVKRVVASLPALETGEAWIWNPEAGRLSRERMPWISTFDSSLTPSADEGHVEPVGLAQIDLGPLRAALEVPEPEAKVPTGKAAALSIEERSTIWNAARAEGHADGYAKGLEEGERTGRAKERARLWARIGKAFEVEDEIGAQAPAEPLPVKRSGRFNGSASTETKPAVALNGALPSGAAKMLAVLDTNPPIRMSWNALAASVGNKARGGHFNSMRKALVSGGHVIEEGGLVRHGHPSDAASPPMSGDELAAHLRGQWKAILGGRAAEIIEILHQSQIGLTKGTIATVIGCAAHGGHWNSSWKALRDNDLIVQSGDTFRLAPELTPPKENSNG